MLKLIGVASMLIGALFLQACAPKSQDSCGFVQNSYGERVSWKAEVPVTMYLHTSVPEEYVGAIVAAAHTWEESAGRKLFNIVTTPRISGQNSPRQDGKNVIYFMDTWESDRPFEQARTSVLWKGDQINETDIRVNTKDFTFYWNQGKSRSSVNIEALMLHEMGHVLGLKHNDEETAGSVMATYLANGTDRTEPSSVDTTDLKCEY